MTMRRMTVVVIASAVLAIGALFALFPGFFASFDPELPDMQSTLLPPSAEHLFGTDKSGRDIFSRIVYGARVSLGIGVVASLGAVLLGLALGSLIGVAPKRLDAVVMRIVDVMLAIPEFLLALVVVAILGPGILNLAIAVMIAATPVYIRLARGHVRTLRGAEYVEASRLLGTPRVVVLAKHIMPDVLRRLSVVATIGIGSAILAASGLSFLGLGVTEPTAEWGLMLSSGRNQLATAWWISVFPGLAITLTVVAASTLGRIARARVEGGSR